MGQIHESLDKWFQRNKLASWHNLGSIEFSWVLRSLSRYALSLSVLSASLGCFKLSDIAGPLKSADKFSRFIAFGLLPFWFVFQI